jgi:hypothetical protein
MQAEGTGIAGPTYTTAPNLPTPQTQAPLITRTAPVPAPPPPPVVEQTPTPPTPPPPWTGE